MGMCDDGNCPECQEFRRKNAEKLQGLRDAMAAANAKYAQDSLAGFMSRVDIVAANARKTNAPKEKR